MLPTTLRCKAREGYSTVALGIGYSAYELSVLFVEFEAGLAAGNNGLMGGRVVARLLSEPCQELHLVCEELGATWSWKTT